MMAPWQEYVQAARALFGTDPDVRIDYREDGDTRTMEVRVHGNDKAESIRAILPAEKTFGNVTMGIRVIPDNDGELTPADHLRRAFAGNINLIDVEETPLTPTSFGATYALFLPEVVQYYTDDLTSPYGLRTAAIERVAREVLQVPEGVFCTSAEM